MAHNKPIFNRPAAAAEIIKSILSDVMDEKTYYRDMRDKAATPNLVFVFGVNIPNGVNLPGVGQLTAKQADIYTSVN